MSHAAEVKRRLDAHHGGAAFHDQMMQSFAGRFGDEFWSLWQQHVVPHQSNAPTYVDFGCGPGLLLEEWRRRFPASTLVGVELQEYMLATARKVSDKVSAQIVAADLHTVALPLSAESVDAALISMVIHEMHEPVGLLLEARRVLKPTGRLVISDWVRSPLATYLTRWPEAESLSQASGTEIRSHHFDHFMEHCKFTADDLTWLVQKLGFVVEHSASRSNGQYLTLVLRAA